MVTTRKKSKTGKIRKKRSDTLVKNIEKQYNVDLGVRSDMKLETLLKKKGLPSMSKVIKERKKNA
jgi:hypothetical protein